MRYLERLPDTVRDDLGIPDIDVFLPGRLLRYDIASGEAVLVDRLAADDGAAAAAAARVGEALGRARRPSPAALHGNDLPVFRSTFTQAEYEEVVRRTREYVFAGDIFQANLVAAARPLLRAAEPAPLRHAAHRQPQSPFAGYLHFGDYELISSSPERLVSLDAEGWAETRPIAGTRPRGSLTPRTTSPTSSTSTPRTAPSTSCWSTSSATTSARSASTARCASTS